MKGKSGNMRAGYKAETKTGYKAKDKAPLKSAACMSKPWGRA